MEWVFLAGLWGLFIWAARSTVYAKNFPTPILKDLANKLVKFWNGE